MPNRFTTTLALVAAAVAGGLILAGCGGASDEIGGSSATASGSGSSELSLVAYSTPQVVYDEVIPAFGKTSDGNGVSFKTSFGPSGEQSRAVEDKPHHVNR